MFFSIIVATRNAAKTIEAMLLSLSVQTCRDFELIIKDACSTDETLEIVERFRSSLPSVCVLSGYDAGVYDAWEKVLPDARGEWVSFLGADDQLASETVLESVRLKLLHAADSVMFALGHMTYVRGGKDVVTLYMYPEGMRSILPFENPIGHAAVFHKRTFFDTHHFDTSFKILGDYDFFCRFWKDDIAIPLHELIARVSLGGLSNNSAWLSVTQRESAHIRFKYFPCTYIKAKLLSVLNPYLLHVKRILRSVPFVLQLYRYVKKIVRR